MLTTLYGKISLAFFALMCFIGIIFFILVRFSSEMYQHEVNQKLNSDLAQHIVDDALLVSDNQINEAALKNVFHMLMVINPSIEIYLLDKEGQILAYSAPPGKVISKFVNLDTIRFFLDKPSRFPIFGDDPRNPGHKKVFSAAKIQRHSSNGTNGADSIMEGYLYVILGGEKFDSVVEMLQNSYILRFSIWWLVAGLLFLVISGLIVFAVLTGRLKRLSQAMDSFARGGYDEPEAIFFKSKQHSNDEIDRLGTHFNRMAERIDFQIKELKRADSLRRELIANVSHDLRTPLASLSGYLETLLLKANSLDETEKRKYLEIAMKHSTRLTKLVAELFELAKLDSYETVLYDEPFSLAELIQDVLQKFQLAAQSKQINLKMDINRNVPPVHGDIGLMQRVLENLIENALRYTPENGQITLSLVPSGNQVQVQISDNGCGIPKQAIPHIFNRFYRLEENSENTTQNAGLGLAITKRILELHGSSIDVVSELNRGTTFSFHMPAV